MKNIEPFWTLFSPLLKAIYTGRLRVLADDCNLLWTIVIVSMDDCKLSKELCQKSEQIDITENVYLCTMQNGNNDRD